VQEESLDLPFWTSTPRPAGALTWTPVRAITLTQLIKSCEDSLGFRPPLISTCSNRLVLQEEQKRILLLPWEGTRRVPQALHGLAKDPGLPIAKCTASGELQITDEARLLFGRCQGKSSQHSDSAEWLQLASRLEANLGSFNSELNAHVESGDAESAGAVLAQINERRLTPDVVTYTALMKAGARSGSHSPVEVERIVLSAVQEKILVDIGFFATALYAFARVGDLPRAERCVSIMRDARIVPDLASYNSLIHAASKAGQLHRVEHWLDQGCSTSAGMCHSLRCPDCP